MTRKAEKEFRWVHEFGGRREAAEYLCSLKFGSEDIDLMMKRLSHWTNDEDGKGKMGGPAVRAMAEDRSLRPEDFDVMTLDEYAADMRQDHAA